MEAELRSSNAESCHDSLVEQFGSFQNDSDQLSTVQSLLEQVLERNVELQIQCMELQKQLAELQEKHTEVQRASEDWEYLLAQYSPKITHPDSFVSFHSEYPTDDSLSHSQRAAPERLVEEVSGFDGLRCDNDIQQQIAYNCNRWLNSCDEFFFPFQHLTPIEFADALQSDVGLKPEHKLILEIMNVKPYQLSLLQKSNILLETSSALDKGKIILEGIQSDILKKKAKIMKSLFQNSCFSRTLYKEDGIVRMLREKLFSDYIEKCLMENSISIVWMVEGQGQNKIIIYGFTERDVDSGLKVFEKELSYLEIPLNDLNRKILQHPLWFKFRKERESQPLLKLEQTGAKIKIYGACEVVHRTKETIDQILSDKKRHIKNFLQPASALIFLFWSVSKQCRKIVESFKNNSLRLECDEAACCFTISGPTLFISEIEAKIKGLGNKIITEEVVLKGRGMVEHFRSAAGRNKLENIQLKHRVYIKSLTTSYQERERRNVNLSNRSSQSSGCELDEAFPWRRVHQNGVNVKLKVGDIATCWVDVIINVVDEHLKPVEGDYGTVFDAGGPSIQRVCDDYIVGYGPRLEGDILVTRAGLLPCKKIFHIVAPNWNNRKCVETLERTVNGILNKAEEYNCRSLALPIIGLVDSGLAWEKVCRTILKAITDWADVNRDCQLRELYIMSNNYNIVKTFQFFIMRNDGFGDPSMPDTASVAEQLPQDCDQLASNQQCLPYEKLVKLTFLAMDRAAIRDAVAELMEHGAKVIQSTVIDDEGSARIIKRLTHKQIEQIKDLQREFCVHIDVNKVHERIRIQGESRIIIAVKSRVLDIFQQY